jgi:phosphate transport system substrate-binding protein
MTRAAFALAAVVTLDGAAESTLPVYAPGAAVAGDIRVWGSPADAGLLEDWEAGFRKAHPAARIVATLHGPESTMAGLYTGVADIAFLAREMRLPLESMAYEWVKLSKPFTVEIANAGVRTPRPAAVLGVFVARDNPLTHVSLGELDGIFGAEHRRAARNVRTWGELGLEGPWSGRAIRPYSRRIDDVAVEFFRRRVLDDSYRWNPDLVEAETDAELFAAIARDPSGIAVAPLAAATGAVQTVAVAATDGGPYLLPTAASVADRSYPLTRAVTMAVDRAPGKPLAANVREFLRFVLSAEGQAAVARDGAYVPLRAADAQLQLRRLD